MTKMSSWGRLSAHKHVVIDINDRSQIPALLQSHKPGLAYGMGRSYGDVCLNPDGFYGKQQSWIGLSVLTIKPEFYAAKRVYCCATFNALSYLAAGFYR